MRLFELKDRPQLDKEFDRNIMPQIRKNNLEDGGFEFQKKKIKLSKLKPVQSQRVHGMHDKAMRGFQDGSIRPIIVDKNNYIVNGHHRYDVARSLDMDKVKVLKVNATVEELIDYYSDTASDEPTIEEQLKAKLQQKLKEIGKDKPYDNNEDDNSYITSIYNDASGSQKFGENAYIKKASIPGLSKNEVYDNGTSRHIFLINQEQPIFLLTLKNGLDGWITTNVVTHSQFRGKGLAVPVYIAVSNTYKQPLYSFTSQTPAGHKIWQNLAKKIPNRVIGYDTVAKKEIPFDSIYDGNLHTRAKLLPGSVQEGDLIQGNFPNNKTPKDNIVVHVFISPAPGVKPDWIPSKAGFIKDQYQLSREIEKTLSNGIKPEHIKVQINGIYINMPEFGITEDIKEDVVGMNPHAVKPFFSPDEADRANDEWVNQAQVDQEDGVIVKGTDGKQYRIMTSYGNQHFEDGEVYLDGLTDPKYIDPEGYPDAAELLYYHSATGHYPKDPDEIDENVNDWFDQDKFNKIFARRKKKNFSPAVRKYIDSKNWKLSTVNVADLDDQAIDDQFGRVIDTDPSVGVDLDEPIYVHADGRTILDGFHRVYQAKRVGKKVLPAFVPESIDENFNDPAFTPTLTLDQMLSKLKKDMDKTGTGNNFHSDWLDWVGKNKVFKLKTIPIDSVSPADGWQGDQNNIDKLFKSNLSDSPIIVVHKNGAIIDGNHRHQALKKQGAKTIQAFVGENFKDGKKKGKSRPGRVKRAGASCKGSVTSLRKKAKNSSGEKAKMYHWCANMKSGRKKS